VRRELWNAYALFVAAYRAAAEKLRAGIRDVAFPGRKRWSDQGRKPVLSTTPGRVSESVGSAGSR
jgi:hypothetical protein